MEGVRTKDKRHTPHRSVYAESYGDRMKTLPKGLAFSASCRTNRCRPETRGIHMMYARGKAVLQAFDGCRHAVGWAHFVHPLRMSQQDRLVTDCME